MARHTPTRSAPTPAELVGEWITSSDARAAARFELRRIGFPDPALGADDLLGDVAARVLARLADGGPVDPDRIVGYLRASLRNAALDVVRSARARRVGPLLGPDDEGDGAAHDPPDPRTEVPSDVGGRADDVRMHLLQGALADPPWVLSGALTFVALAAEPALLDVARSVQPDGGSPRSRLLWTALSYSGRRDDLPGLGRPDDPACRKRRSRTMAAIDAVLVRAGAASVEGDR